MQFPDHEIAAKRYSRCVRRFLLNHARFFATATLAAVALRTFFLIRFPAVVDDSRLYADIAENWLRHGIYGVTNSGVIMPTLSRLPGYPTFLAIIFALFGIGNFRAVLVVQILFDVTTCFLIADFTRRILSDRAAKVAFLLAALCPFLANYAATALTETLEIFFTALALDFAVSALQGEGAKNTTWFGCGLAIGGGILLRPDGGILLGVTGLYLFWLLLRGMVYPQQRVGMQAGGIIRAGLLVLCGALLPLVPWTVRNLHNLHRFEPLAPRYANDSDEPVMIGFNRWVKTWMAEYVSVEEIYWNVPGEEIDVNRLPSRAFDSAEQKELTAKLFADYNRDHDMSPELDARFGVLAADRIHASAFRYYVWLPFLRIADMWLRPRTELFPADPRWWELNDDRRWLVVSFASGILNVLYVVLAGMGFLRVREYFGIGLFVLFLGLRSLFLGTLENPEPRYTLECYPVVMFFVAALFHRRE